MNNKLKVVIFNAPPRLGKDTAVEHLIKQTNTEDTFYTAHHRAFKDSLFKLCANMLGRSVESFLDGYDETVGEYFTRKDKKLLSFEDSTQWFKDYTSTITQRVVNTQYSKRELLIHMSENIIKPVFGKDAFGKAMVASLPKQGIVFISDGGFPEELIPVVDHVGEDNLLVVRIHREGVDFAGDSRAYLDQADLGGRSISMEDIDNDSTLEVFLHGVEGLVGEWLNN